MIYDKDKQRLKLLDMNEGYNAALKSKHQKDEELLNEALNVDLSGVSERLFICSVCNTEYITESKEPYIGCCIMPIEHRTSGVCGGELIERI